MTLPDATRGDARVEVASVHQLLVRWIEESREYGDDDADDADDAGANDDDEPASDGD